MFVTLAMLTILLTHPSQPSPATSVISWSSTELSSRWQKIPVSSPNTGSEPK